MGWKNREDYLAYHRRRYREKKGRLVELRSKPCTDCHETFEWFIMEFDHVPERGPKRFNITDGCVDRLDFKLELAKCDLVCANCHARRTYNRKQAGLIQR